MPEKEDCACRSAPKLIFACSGAADVGRVSDMAARTMTKDGVGSMFCLAGVGGRVSKIMDRTKAASRILAIDGCSLGCAKQCLEFAGFKEFGYGRLDLLGMEKGETAVNPANIAKVSAEGSRILDSSE